MSVSLVCLPPAGGSAVMARGWRAHLDPDVRIHPANPRRAAARAGTTDLVTVAEALVADLPEPPYVVVGHSLGGLLGLELVHAAARVGAPAPAGLVVMGSRPPQAGTADLFAPLLDLDDDALVTALVGLGALTPGAAASAARALFLPGLRADLRLVAGYRPARGLPGPVAVPLEVWHGVDDPVAPPRLAPLWWPCAASQLVLRRFRGDHDFPTSHAPAVAAALDAVVRRWVPSRTSRLADVLVP